MDPDEESTAADDDDFPDDPKLDFPPEVSAAREKAWNDFEAPDSPTREQMEAFVEELLALPHAATDWNDVFDAVRQADHPDILKVFRRLATALAPTRNRNFAHICWAATEQFVTLKTPQCLPEIARTLLDFNPQTCEPDALSHIADALLAHGNVNEMIELIIGFLPSLRDNEDLMSWVLPRVAEEIFLLRLGTLIASTGDYAHQPIDHLFAALCADLDDEIEEDRSRVPLRYLMQERANFSHEQFRVPSSVKDSGKQEILWNGLQQAFVEIARDEWLTADRDPSRTLIGLSMILRAVESYLASHREKGRKYPLNLLDYLNTASLDRLVATECGDILGVNLERAFIMLDACVALTRWASRQGLLDDKETANAEKDLAQFLKKIGH